MALVLLRTDRTSKPPLHTPLRSDGHWGVEGLMGAWAFNEQAGKTAFDCVANNNATSPLPAFTPNGIATSAATPTSAWDVPVNIMAGKSQLSLIAVMKSSASSGGYITCWLSDTNMSAFLYQVSNGTVGFRTRTVTTVAMNPAGSVADGKFHTIAGIYSGSDMSVWVDGVERGTRASQSGVIATPTTATTKIGAYSTATLNAEFNAALIYDRALSPDEIASLSANPWQIYEPEIQWVWVEDGAGATTSAADPGSLTATGSAATDYRGLISGSAVGTLTATGSAATSIKGFLSVAESGATPTSGTNAADYRGLISSAESGAITTTGTDSTGLYTPVGSITSTAQPGATVVIGVNAAGLRTFISLTEPGSVNLTGVNASGFRGLLSVTEIGALAVTGINSADTTGELTSIAPYSALSVNGYNTTDYRPGREIPIFSGRSVPIIRGRELSLTLGRTIPVIQ